MKKNIQSAPILSGTKIIKNPYSNRKLRKFYFKKLAEYEKASAGTYSFDEFNKWFDTLYMRIDKNGGLVWKIN